MLFAGFLITFLAYFPFPRKDITLNFVDRAVHFHLLTFDDYGIGRHPN